MAITQAQKDAAVAVLTAALDAKNATGANVSQYNGKVVPNWNDLAVSITAAAPQLKALGLDATQAIALLNQVVAGFGPAGKELRRLLNAALAVVPDPVVTPPVVTPPTPPVTPPVVSPLATLAANTARNLGLYANPISEFSTSPLNAANIIDYSGFCLDAAGNRILMFGGGHGPSQETDIRIFDLATLGWSSLYPSTSVADMTLANLDIDEGRWISTNHPTARHTYDATLVRGRKFHLLTPRGMPDGEHLPALASIPTSSGDNGTWGGRMAVYDFDAKTWSYGRYGSNLVAAPNDPGNFSDAAELDPVSQKIVICGSGPWAGAGGLWLYDPDADSFAPGPQDITINGGGSLVYFPPTDRFYYIRNDGSAWEIVVDRTTFANSTLTQLTVTGDLPQPNPNLPGVGMAYDSVNKLLGGACRNGKFYALDPAKRVWLSKTAQLESGSTGTPNADFHCTAFDPNSGCYVFLCGPNSGFTATTWAYCWERAVAPSTPPTTSTGLTATLDFGGGKIAHYAQATATPIATIVGEFVQQRRWHQVDPAFPAFRVIFGQDVNAVRDEVLIGYGRKTVADPELAPPYTLTIAKDGVTVKTEAVAAHWRYAQYPWLSSPRPIVRTPETLMARGWIPRFGTSGMFGGGADANDIAWPGPLKPLPAAFEDALFADGGDHLQLGHLTECQASYCIFGAAQNERTLRAEGMNCHNWPMFIRNDDGSIPDVRAMDGSGFFVSDGGTIIDLPNLDPTTTPGFVRVEQAHWYPCANLLWMLTDDPSMAEAMQCGLNVRLITNRTVRIETGFAGLLDPQQTRAFAWGLRDLFQMHAALPDAVPAWLRPKSYWKSIIDDNKAFALQFVNSPARIHKTFRVMTRTSFDSSWQAAWLSTVAGAAVDQGFSDWQPIFDWLIGAQLARTNGTSGWNRQWPAPYRSTPLKDDARLDVMKWDAYTDTSIDAGTCTDWADYFAFYAAGQHPATRGNGSSDDTGHTLDPSKWDGHTLMAPTYDTAGGKYTFAGYPSYFLHLRAALALAVKRNTPGAQACYDYLQAEMSALPKTYMAGGQCRFALAP